MAEGNRVPLAERGQAQDPKSGRVLPTHGVYSVREHGALALDEAARLTWLQLREELRLPQAREDLRLEILARLRIMCGVGFDELQRLAATGENVWDAPITKRFATYLGLLVRLLRDWGPDPSDDRMADPELVAEVRRQIRARAVDHEE